MGSSGKGITHKKGAWKIGNILHSGPGDINAHSPCGVSTGPTNSEKLTWIYWSDIIEHTAREQIEAANDKVRELCRTADRLDIPDDHEAEDSDEEVQQLQTRAEARNYRRQAKEIFQSALQLRLASRVIKRPHG